MRREQLLRGFRVGEWVIRPEDGVVTKGDQTTSLRPQMMSLLVALAEQAGRTVPRDQLYQEIWGSAIVEEGGLTRNISELRSVLGDDTRQPVFIRTAPKIGYEFLATPLPLVDTPRWFARWGREKAAATLMLSVALAAIVGVAIARSETSRVGFSSVRTNPEELPPGLSDCGLVSEAAADALPGALAASMAEKGELVVLEDFGPVAGGTSARAHRGRRLTAIISTVVDCSGPAPKVSLLGRALPTGTVIWSDVRSLVPSEVGPWVEKVAPALAAAATRESPAATGLTRQSPHETDLVHLIRQARSNDFEEITQAIEGFVAEARRQPANARIQAELGRAYLALHRYPVAREELVEGAEAAARRALDLEAGNSTAQLVLAETALRYRFDRPLARRHINRVLKASPRDTQALDLRATLLTLEGRHSEAIAAARELNEFLPLDRKAVGRESLALFMAGEFDEAGAVLQRFYDPHDARQVGNHGLGLFNQMWYSGQGVEALRLANEFLAGRGAPPASSVDDFLERWLASLHGRQRVGFHHLAEIAFLTGELGQHSEAVTLALEACRSRSGWYSAYLGVDPRARSLRDLPEYRQVEHCLSTPIASRPFQLRPKAPDS